MKAMLSIRPEYVERILSGEKTYEFRRRIFRRGDVDTIAIYSTSPCCRVVAEARIGGIIRATPEEVWERTRGRGGIGRDEFMAYFDGAGTAYAIRLAAIDRFEEPRELADYGMDTAPQSFAYVR